MRIFWKSITDGRLKMLCVGISVKHTLCSLYWNQNKLCKKEQREDNYYNLLKGKSKFSNELTFWVMCVCVRACVRACVCVISFHMH